VEERLQRAQFFQHRQKGIGDDEVRFHGGLLLSVAGVGLRVEG
jgi:hypothetical protein